MFLLIAVLYTDISMFFSMTSWKLPNTAEQYMDFRANEEDLAAFDTSIANRPQPVPIRSLHFVQKGKHTWGVAVS